MYEVVMLAIPYTKVNLIYNTDYHLGMFSSILYGIKVALSDCFFTSM